MRDRCHHFFLSPDIPDPEYSGWLAKTAMWCLPPYLGITRPPPLSGDSRLPGRSERVRSRAGNYISKTTINGPISAHTCRSETFLRLPHRAGFPADDSTLMCVICHTGRAGCFAAVLSWWAIICPLSLRDCCCLPEYRDW